MVLAQWLSARPWLILLAAGSALVWRLDMVAAERDRLAEQLEAARAASAALARQMVADRAIGREIDVLREEIPDAGVELDPVLRDVLARLRGAGGRAR